MLEAVLVLPSSSPASRRLAVDLQIRQTRNVTTLIGVASRLYNEDFSRSGEGSLNCSRWAGLNGIEFGRELQSPCPNTVKFTTVSAPSWSVFQVRQTHKKLTSQFEEYIRCHESLPGLSITSHHSTVFRNQNVHKPS